MTMTNKATMDAMVVEITRYYKGEKICPEKEGYGFRGEDNEFKVCRDCGHKYARNEIGKHEKNPPPFISAPTNETDGIVLKWVQGYSLEEFRIRLVEIIKESAGIRDAWPFPDPLGQFLSYYKPGDYAHALLAVKEERDG